MPNSFAVHEGFEVRAEITSTVDAGLLWRAWVERDKFSAWFVDDAEGEVVTGGTWTWVWRDFGRATYRIIDAAPPRRFLARLEDERPGGVLEVVIEPRGQQTAVVVINSGFAAGTEDEQVAGVASGWVMALAILKRYVERYFGEHRSRFSLMRPASFDYATIRYLHREEQGLARWLTAGGSIGAPGTPVRLTLWNGERLTGEVLATTEHETAIAWNEMRGVLELKAFAAGPGQRMLALTGCFWNPPRPIEEIRAMLEPRFDLLSVSAHK